MNWAKFHATAACMWALLLIPSVVWWRDSVPWLVFMSVWANLASHWSAFQASRTTGGEDDSSTPVSS